jgi:acyl-CoA reductase-like NAD-dependent aldehyde dehydrogenase
MLVSINPADGEVCGTVAVTAPEALDGVVEAAWQAFRHSGWRTLRPDQRSAALHRVSAGLLANKARLARLQMLDSGKPLQECGTMVESAAAAFRYYAGVIETYEGAVTPPRGKYVSLDVLEPYGVVVAITPWNSPIMNEAQKIAPALAAGNAVIVKPSEVTPLLAPELMRLCLEAGIPENQVQVVQGSGGAQGAALVAHPGVRMISFTGGCETGRRIAASAGQSLKPVILELGGKSPHIVFEDADLPQACAAVASGIFGASGQTCIAGSRLFVHARVYDEVVARIVAIAKAAKVAAPDDAGVEVGPLVSFAHRDKVRRHVEEGLGEGGRLLAGGAAPGGDRFARGAYYAPTVIDGLDADSRLCQEEIFGPVLVALRFDDDDGVVRMANGTQFGLACGLWTADFKRAWRTARAIEAGMVWINTYRQSSISSPFGGVKASGIGREKGIVGLESYSQHKSIYLGLDDGLMEIAR